MRAFPIIHDLCVLKSIEENRILKKPRKKGKPAPFMLAVAFAFAVSLCFSLRIRRRAGVTMSVPHCAYTTWLHARTRG